MSRPPNPKMPNDDTPKTYKGIPTKQKKPLEEKKRFYNTFACSFSEMPLRPAYATSTSQIQPEHQNTYREFYERLSILPRGYKG